MIPSTLGQKVTAFGINKLTGSSFEPEDIPIFQPTASKVFNTNPAGTTPVSKTITMQEFKEKTAGLEPEEVHKTYLRIRDEKGIEVAGYGDFINQVRQQGIQITQQETKKYKEKRKTQDTAVNQRNEIMGAVGQDKLDGVDKWLTKETPKWATLDEDASWGEVGKSALINFLPSSFDLAKGTVFALKNPLTTAKTIAGLGLGVTTNVIEGLERTSTKGANFFLGAMGYEKLDPEDDSFDLFKDMGKKLGIEEIANSEEMADMVGDFYKKKYGTIEGFKKMVGENPAELISDIAMVVSGGSAVAGKLATKGSSTASTLMKVSKVANKVDDFVTYLPLKAGAFGAKKVAGAGLNVIENLSGFNKGTRGVVQKYPKLFKEYYSGVRSLDDIKNTLRDTKELTNTEVTKIADNLNIIKESGLKEASEQVVKTEDTIISKIESGLKMKEKAKSYEINKIVGIESVKFETRPILDALDEAIKSPTIGTQGVSTLKKLKANIQADIGPANKNTRLESVVNIDGQVSLKNPATTVGWDDLSKIKSEVKEMIDFTDVGTKSPAEASLNKVYKLITEQQETLLGVKEINKKYGEDISEINKIRKEIYSRPGELSQNIITKIRSLNKDTNRLRKNIFKDIDINDDLVLLGDLINKQGAIEKVQIPKLAKNYNEANVSRIFGDEFLDGLKQVAKKSGDVEFIDKLLGDKDFSISKLSSNLLSKENELTKTASLLGMPIETLKEHLNVVKVLGNMENTLASTTGKSTMRALSAIVGGIGGKAYGLGPIGIIGAGAIGFIASNPKVALNIFEAVGLAQNLPKTVVNGIIKSLKTGKGLTEQQMKRMVGVIGSDEFQSKIMGGIDYLKNKESDFNAKQALKKVDIDPKTGLPMKETTVKLDLPDDGFNKGGTTESALIKEAKKFKSADEVADKFTGRGSDGFSKMSIEESRKIIDNISKEWENATISSNKIDFDIQGRHFIKEDISFNNIKGIINNIKKGNKIDPIIINKKGKVIDGNHRMLAQYIAGVNDIDVIMPRGIDISKFDNLATRTKGLEKQFDVFRGDELKKIREQANKGLKSKK